MSIFAGVKLKLIGEDGNSFSILGRAQRAARRAKIPGKDIQDYMDKATSGDYDHLLRTTMEYFECD